MFVNEQDILTGEIIKKDNDDFLIKYLNARNKVEFLDIKKLEPKHE